MRITHVPQLTLAALAALSLAACADTPTAGPAEPGGPLHAAAADTAAPPQEIVYEGEKEYEEIASQVPGYAAHWYDEDGNRVVALTDPSQEALALRVIESRSEPEPAEGETRTGATRVIQVKHDFVTLRDWRNRANFPLFSEKGVVLLDLDEQRNALFVGVADESARAGAEAQLRAAGVPLDAAIIEVTGAPELYQTLQNFFRPLQSGYQIQNAPGGGICTLGVPGLTAGPSYITNSHCTQVYWWNTGTAFYQHLNLGGPWFIGNEAVDPPGWACGGGWVCRWSDAALVPVAAGVPAANQIARTAWWGVHWNPGSLNTGGIAAFNVVNPPQWWPLLGQVVDKVGRTTGWNRGVVTHTCVNLSAFPGRMVLCQYLMTNMAGPGDSGSPVFRQLPNNQAQVTGLLWGGIVTPWFKRSIFSPRGGVFVDLGA
ncbi:MAG TPA: hypothetical protein VHG08_06525 [Longimicrobium sp.]|nr:hypothetical protein [Longimicrobium sp.]